MRRCDENPKASAYDPKPNTQGEQDPNELIPVHGGYRNLKTFHLSQLIYDVTVRFCRLYVDPRSRTYDQMVQAARSGKQNIAEASIDSGTSRKSELKLTNIARGSLEELRLDYKDFLRDRGLAEWPPNHPALMRFKAKRCATLQEVRDWAKGERARAQSFARSRKVENTGVSVRVFRATRGERRPLPFEPLLLSAQTPTGLSSCAFSG
jgi:four helix bundle protein